MINLITGGAGFIGSHLAEHLLGNDQEVIVLDDLSTGSFDNIAHLVGRKGFTYYIGKVEDKTLLDRAVGSCDRIYHLAAAVGVRLIIEDPVRTIETNINAAQAVLEQAVKFGKPVLVTSSSEVYGKCSDLPFSEDDDVVYGPTSRARWSYAFSKAIDEFLLLSYSRTKGLPGVVVRLFNTVGPRQTGLYGMVVPRFVEQAVAGEPITVYGTGEQERCFAHVLDVVPALLRLMDCKRAFGQVVNVGNDDILSIRALADLVRRLVNPNAQVSYVSYEKAYGSGFEDLGSRQPDLSRLRSLIGFAPTHSIEDIIRDVAAHVRNPVAARAGLENPPSCSGDPAGYCMRP
jgi:UDP-glucose 4-epimerase